MAKGKWKVFEITQCDGKCFIIGRLLDSDKPPLVDNIEFDTSVTHDRDTAQELVYWLNKGEEQKGV
jgi:hypothetical protein